MRRFPILLSSMLLVASACRNGSKEAPAPPAAATDSALVLTAEQAARAALTTATVELRKASDTLRLPGTLSLDPRHSWSLSPTVDGVVEEVGAVAHDVVKKGQVLARLRSASLGEAQLAWLEARGSLRLATADHDRNLPLRKDGIVSESQWLRVDAEFQRASAALAQAERRLSLAGLSAAEIAALESPDRRLGELTLTSPAAGVVLMSSVMRGHAVTAGQNAFDVADLSTLWVLVHIPVASIAQVKPGAKAVVRVPGSAHPGWNGELGSLGGNVDAADQTVEGRIVVTNVGGFLRPGMYAEVDVTGVPVDAKMVPSAAAFSVGNQAWLFQKIDATRFLPLPVTAGPPVGEWTPVSGPGVTPGLEVVVGGLAELKSHWLYKKAE